MNLRLILLGGVAGLCGVASPVLAQEAPPATLDEVVVTGSLLNGGDRVAPLQVLGRDRIRAAGISDAARLTTLTPVNSGSEYQVDQLNFPQSSGTAQFNLRNLGLGSTLVLVDGRRHTTSAVVATDGSAFVDVNSLIPLIALERIEIVKDGASAIYGSDAVAGVVNFITRRDVDGVEIGARYGFADGTDEVTLEGIGGGALAGGDLVVAASWFQRSSLGSDDRAFAQAETYGFAPWTAVTSYGQPGSYFRPSLNGFSPDPDCDDPAFADDYRTGPADPFCRLDYSDFFDLAPREERAQVFAAWTRPLDATTTLSLDAAWASTVTEVRQSPSLPILAGSLTVPSDHPDNPFGEDVLFRGRLLGAEAGASTALFDYDTWRLAAVLDGALAGGWTWQAAASASRQGVFYDKPDAIGPALQNALNGLGGPDCDAATGAPGVGPCQYFNPFGSAHLGTGTPNDAALIDSLIGYTGLHGASSLTTLDVVTRGRALTWDGGAVDLALGAQLRHSEFRHDWSDLVNAGDLLTAGVSPDFSGDQDVAAAFAEARIRLGAAIEAQVAGRYETYDGEGRFSPKIAVRWAPTDALTLRGAWTQGFRTPSVYAQSGAQASQPSVFDNGAFVFVNTVTSGDPDLAPEESDSLSLGVQWRPFDGLTLGVDAWSFDYANQVVKESAQALIDQARADTDAGLTGTDAQGRVQRDGTGALSFVQLFFVNAASIETQGLDVSARYDTTVAGGDLSASATWTHVDRYDIHLNAAAPTVSGVGSANLNTIGRSLPQDRVEGAISWSRGANALTGLVHYTSGYRNDRAGITQADIASHTTVDLFYARDLGAGLDLSLGVINLFDRDPPLAQFTFGYDPVVADPRGRVVTVGLSKLF